MEAGGGVQTGGSVQTGGGVQTGGSVRKIVSRALYDNTLCKYEKKYFQLYKTTFYKTFGGAASEHQRVRGQKIDLGT